MILRPPRPVRRLLARHLGQDERLLHAVTVIGQGHCDSVRGDCVVSERKTEATDRDLTREVKLSSSYARPCRSWRRTIQAGKRWSLPRAGYRVAQRLRRRSASPSGPATCRHGSLLGGLLGPCWHDYGISCSACQHATKVALLFSKSTLQTAAAKLRPRVILTVGFSYLLKI